MTKLEQFTELWMSMSSIDKDRVLRFLVNIYGKNLLFYMRFINSSIDKLKE